MNTQRTLGLFFYGTGHLVSIGINLISSDSAVQEAFQSHKLLVVATTGLLVAVGGIMTFFAPEPGASNVINVDDIEPGSEVKVIQPYYGPERTLSLIFACIPPFVFLLLAATDSSLWWGLPSVLCFGFSWALYQIHHIKDEQYRSQQIISFTWPLWKNIIEKTLETRWHVTAEDLYGLGRVYGISERSLPYALALYVVEPHAMGDFIMATVMDIQKRKYLSSRVSFDGTSKVNVPIPVLVDKRRLPTQGYHVSQELNFTY